MFEGLYVDSINLSTFWTMCLTYCNQYTKQGFRMIAGFDVFPKFVKQ